VKNSAWLLISFFTIFSFVSCSKRTVRVKPVTVYANMAEDDAVFEDIILENEYLSLRFMPKTTAIILTDKASGVQWHSNPKGNEVDRFADVVTSYMMDSQFTLEYSDFTGVAITMYSSQSSVLLKAYEYEVVDGILEVRYTVGDNVRTYRVPPAVPEEKMEAYLAKMGDREQGIVETSYDYYDISDLRSSGEEDAFLAAYPDLAKTNLYILRDNIREYLKEMMEGIFSEAGYTYEDYLEDAEKYPAASGMNRPAFNLTLRYILDGKSLVVNVPFDQIAYRPNFPFRRLTLLPFMGSGSVNDDGFMLVPDGSGSIINFNNGKYSQVPFSVNIYGWDETMPRDAVVSDTKAPFPAFGIQKNGAALFCIIEEGASYAGIRADVSGRNASWNRVYPYFDIVHGTSLDIVGRNERNVYVFENGLPDGESITLRYTLCSNPGYMGMANEYRAWLQKKYPELGKTKIDGVPVAVEVVGAVNKTRHRLGIPFDLPLKLTSYEDTVSIVNDLAGFGWKNVKIKLNGWFNRSVDHSVPTKIKLISELGTKKDFQNIISTANKNNFEVYPEVDFVLMRDVKQFSGFSLYRDVARFINRERAQHYPFSFVWFGERKMWGKLNYVARPSSTVRMIDNFVPKAANLGIKNIAFRNYGSKLTGDYHEKRHVSREASIGIRQKKLGELKNSGTEVLINTGFDFAAPFADIITDVMLDDQYFGITDTAVPFYPIVLHGLVPFTGKAINLAEDYSKNLLKSVESGAGLYFSFMKEETSELQETKFRQFYANEYDKWVGDANALYRQFTADFGKLYNQAIVDHRILSHGVSLTVYQDGTEVVVNISDNDWTYQNGGIVVKANSYSVVK